jgi:LPS sulfotransferase NodH
MNIRSAALHHLVRSRPQPRVPAQGADRGAIAPFARGTALPYIICTSPRSGSWLLSDGLASTARAGNPREWFNILEEQQHRARWRMEHGTDLSYAAYLRLAAGESTTRNGISGTKLHYYQFAELPRRMAAIPALRGLASGEVLTTLFPRAKYILLTRRDKVRQAISFLIATGTDEWWAIDGVTADKRDSAAEPEFDPRAIERMEHAFAENDRKWQAFFAENDITPLVVHYEDLVADYRGTILHTLWWLGVADADAAEIPPSRLKRQSDGRNEDWLKRYAAFRKRSSKSRRKAAAAAQDDPLSARVLKMLETVPLAWKQWIAQCKVRNVGDEAIVAVLTGNGYSREAALAEVGKAAADRYLVGAVRTQRRLNKAVALLNIQGQLARLDSRARIVDRRTDLSRDEFRDRYYAANRPVIIQGLMQDWPAMSAWTPDYLARVAGEEMVEVMTGRGADPRYETSGNRPRGELRFADYVDRLRSGKVGADNAMVASNRVLQGPQGRRLLQDFAAFPRYLRPVVDGSQCFLWLGPAGTVMPLHHAACNALLAQLAGSRRYRMIPAAEWSCVYAGAGVFSDVDGERPDLRRHPKFRAATVIDVVVHPGEVLFVPVGWWNHIRALDAGMTISFTNFVFPNRFKWE